MLAKVTSKNQISLPKAIISQFSEVEYFDVASENGKIILTPMRVYEADSVRSKLERLGITEDDVTDAIAFARQR